MNDRDLKDYYRRQYERYHKEWEDTGSDQAMQEALNYLNALEKLTKSK